MSRHDAEATATSARDAGREAGARGAAPYLFLVLSCDAPLSGGSAHCLKGVDQIVITRGAARTATRSETGGRRVLTLEIPSSFVSRGHARIERVLGDFIVLDEGSRNGTFVNGERSTRQTLADGDVLECGHSLFVFRASLPLASPEDGFDLDVDPRTSRELLPSLRPDVRESHRMLARVAAARLPILLLGESGTGKEITARAIHAASGRASGGGALVPVNCGAIPQGLVESQLFGHVKGAFSGATRDELGVFRAADKGTLLLDEIGDLPLASQVALLRALEEGTVTPVGTTRGVPVDVRVVAATHRPLDTLVREGRFRADLLARLSGYVHPLLPLRDRREDLGLLVSALLTQLDAADVTFSVDAGLKLVRHTWPLNIRELRSCLAAARVTAPRSALEAAHLRFPLGDGAAPLPRVADATPALAPADPSDEGVEARLTRLLTEHEGNVAAVARAMGKAPYQIHRWVRQYAIDLGAFRSRR